MTLVYAKIMGMFVCGADPGGRGWGGGGASGGWGIFMKSLQKSIVHICSSLICLGGRPYVCHDVTHARFYQKLDLDPRALTHILSQYVDPSIFSRKFA